MKSRYDYSLATSPIQDGTRTGTDAPKFRDFCPTCGARRHDAQLGSEPLHDCLGWATGNDCGSCYICHMRQVARECWRVLRDDGVMFWNIADSYNSNASNQQYVTGMHHSQAGMGRYNKQVDTLKPKDKCGIPERTTLAFQADGWWWRSDIIWHKPNPMPESVTDRPTKSHEMIYVFTKAERYFWDAEAVREIGDVEAGHIAPFSKVSIEGGRAGAMGRLPSGNEKPGMTWTYTGRRNLRDVWTMATQAYPGAHFATYPAELPRRCIKAATSERGACPKCGKGWERIADIDYEILSGNTGHIRDDRDGRAHTEHKFMGGKKARKISNTLGWRPACTCDAGDPVPCVVFDPFSGAATTGLVARELGRHYIGLELSGEYLQQSRERLGLAALDAWGGNGKAHDTDVTGLPLFGGVK